MKRFIINKETSQQVGYVVGNYFLMADILRILQTALTVVEPYDIHTFTALDTIYNFRVWVSLENNRSLEIGVKNICFTPSGEGGTWNCDYLQ